MFWAYMLRCADGSYYVGQTDDLEMRVAAHQSGVIPGYTHSRRPVSLVWSENFPDRDQAFQTERKLKGWSRAKKEALIAGDWDAIRSLSRRTVLRDEASTSSASPQDERLPGSAARTEEGQGETERVDPRPPVFVLVRPQLGENIGKAARAMLNFGLTEMRLVSPRDGWPNPSAGPAASGADRVLEQAQVYDSVAAATADCSHVFATTVRRRDMIKPVVTPAEAATAIHADPGRAAILFGPERTGLETDDVALARTILTVPINPEFGSLNLAQAVILVAYEWSKHVPGGAQGGVALAQPTAIDAEPPASQHDLEGLVDHLDGMLEAAGYFYPPDRVPTTKRSLRSLLTKPAWTAQEIRTLRGVLATIDRPRPPRA